MNKTRIIALILAAVIALSACAMLTGCKNGDNKSTDATTATTAPTTAATTAATAAGSNGNQNSGNNTSSQAQASSAAEGGNSVTSPTTDADGYLSQSDAVANVMQLAGSGATVVSVEKGYSPEGNPAWVVVVQPVTTSDGPETITYYSGYLFCYPDQSSVPEQGNQILISQEEAVANVRQQAGSGASIVSVEEGTSPDGAPCYVVTVQPITAEEDGPETVTYYSGYLFCYKAN